MPALYRGPKLGYKLSEWDRQVLAASIWGEAGETPGEEEAAAVCWGLMMRFQLVDSIWRSSGWPFAKFIQAFSQPVNPSWLDPTGAKCTQHPNSCTPTLLARRKMIQAYLATESGWEGLKSKVPKCTQFAERFYEGDLPNPFHDPVYDFAACSLTKKQMASGHRPGYGINIGGSCFLPYSDLNSKEKAKVIPGRVVTGVAAHALGGAYVIVGVVGAAAAWAWARWWS